jgi:hypothetical protein
VSPVISKNLHQFTKNDEKTESERENFQKVFCGRIKYNKMFMPCTNGVRQDVSHALDTTLRLISS